MTPEAFDQLTTLITVVGTGVGTLAVQIYREGRQRKWALQDREDTLRADLAKQAAQHQAVLDAIALDAARRGDANADDQSGGRRVP